MVLQILADAGKIEHRFDAEAGQFSPRADAGAQQQRRRSDGTRRDDDFLLRLDFVSARPGHQFQPAGAAVIGYDALGHGAGNHLQIGAVPHRFQKRRRRGMAAAIFDGDLPGAPAFLVFAVEIVAQWELQGFGRIQKRGCDRIDAHVIADIQRPALAVKFGFSLAFVILRSPEIGQHLGVGPALIAEVRPFVIVQGMAAHIDHAVDRRRAAEGATPRNINGAVAGVFLIGGGIAPIQDPVMHQRHQRRRNMDERTVVLGPGFDQADPVGRILGQAVGQYAACRAGAGDDVIKLFGFPHRNPIPAAFCWRPW